MMDTGPLPENSTIVRRTVITRYLDADGELCMQLEANDGHEVEGESRALGDERGRLMGYRSGQVPRSQLRPPPLSACAPRPPTDHDLHRSEGVAIWSCDGCLHDLQDEVARGWQRAY
ncbi:hypothetical protein SEA_ANCLAR_65 [Gordonia phage AnClar]|nr:hypothetical protein SEA_ANCLAR_65 [Gordonia phage AnClar]